MSVNQGATLWAAGWRLSFAADSIHGEAVSSTEVAYAKIPQLSVGNRIFSEKAENVIKKGNPCAQ